MQLTDTHVARSVRTTKVVPRGQRQNGRSRLAALGALLLTAATSNAEPLSWQHVADSAPLWSVLPSSVTDPAQRSWFVHGGYASDAQACLRELWAFDAASKQWQLLSEGGPRSSVGSQLLHLADDSACAAGCLLHLGGTAQPCHAAQAAAQDGPLPVHLFSLARDTWQRLAVEAAAANGTVPIGRHSFGAVTRGAQVVLAGGASSRGVLRDVWSLKVSSTAGSVRAERLADLPEARTAHTLTRVAGDRGIVLVGGASDLAMRNVSAACWSLDERGDAWTETARLPEARAYHAAVSTQDGLVVWAGLVAKTGRASAAEQTASALLELRHKSKAWARVRRDFATDAMPAPVGHSAALLAGAREEVLYTWGGVTPGRQGSLDSLYKLRLASDVAWQRALSARPGVVAEASLHALADGRIILFGTEGAQIGDDDSASSARSAAWVAAGTHSSRVQSCTTCIGLSTLLNAGTQEPAKNNNAHCCRAGAWTRAAILGANPALNGASFAVLQYADSLAGVRIGGCSTVREGSDGLHSAAQYLLFSDFGDGLTGTWYNSATESAWRSASLIHHSTALLRTGLFDGANQMLLVWGGIVTECGASGGGGPSSSLNERSTAAAWLFAPVHDAWLSVDVSSSGHVPAARHKHACSASAVAPNTAICTGGLSGDETPLADTWALTLHSFDIEGGSAVGTWRELSTSSHMAGAMHSLTLTVLPPLMTGADGARGLEPAVSAGQMDVLIASGGSRQGARPSEEQASATHGDVWALVVSHHAACSAAPAAWHRIVAALEQAWHPRGTTAAVAQPRHLLVFGSSETQPEQAAHGFSSMAQLDGLACLRTSELPAGTCPADVDLARHCSAPNTASNVSLTLSATGSESAALARMEGALQAVLLDQQDWPYAPLAQLAGQDGAPQRAAPVSTEEQGAAATWHVQMPGAPFRPGSNGSALVTAHGLQVARSAEFELRAVHRKVSIQAEELRRLEVTVDGQPGVRPQARLWVVRSKDRVSWTSIGAPPEEDDSGTFRWQVWYPSRVGSTAHFEVDVEEGASNTTHIINVPFADSAPAAGTKHRIADAAVLSQSHPGSATAALLAVPGATFSVALRVPERMADCVYIPVNVSVALIEYNDTTPAAGTVRALHRFDEFQEPGASAQTLRWRSSPVPSSAESGTEYAVRVYGGLQAIWFARRTLAQAGRTYEHAIELEWFEQSASLAFESALFTPQGTTYPAYNAKLRVFPTSLAQTPLLDIDLDEAGGARVVAVMNTTYTFSAVYPTSIPANGYTGSPNAVREVQLMRAATHRMRPGGAIRLWASVPLLCPDPDVMRHETQHEFTMFPVVKATFAVYRPQDVCNWDILQPGARGLRINANVFWLAEGSVLAFTATRKRDVRDAGDADKVVMTNLGDSRGVGLHVSGPHAALWFYANGRAGYSFYLEMRATELHAGFSWSITMLITSSLLMVACLAWLAWVVRAFMRSRRAHLQREEQRVELALAGVPVPVGVPNTTLQALPETIFKQGSRGTEEECSICLDEFEHGASLQLLPCGHTFHRPCIREWLKGHNFCPLCKYVLTGPTTSTPGDLDPRSGAAGGTVSTFGANIAALPEGHAAAEAAPFSPTIMAPRDVWADLGPSTGAVAAALRLHRQGQSRGGGAPPPARPSSLEELMPPQLSRVRPHLTANETPLGGEEALRRTADSDRSSVSSDRHATSSAGVGSNADARVRCPQPEALPPRAVASGRRASARLHGLASGAPWLPHRGSGAIAPDPEGNPGGETRAASV